MDEYLTSKEAQEYLKVSSVTLWRLAKEGKIAVYKIHNRNRYRRNELDEFMERHRVGGGFAASGGAAAPMAASPASGGSAAV